jgi:benzil reductase ((S)-benzoin forming)
MHFLSSLVCITGASSGIGQALAESVPFDQARLLTVSRRPARTGTWVQADLSDPTQWQTVDARVRKELAAGQVDEATLMHFAGVGAPHEPAAEADPQAYVDAVLLNAASGPVLGQAFLANCRAAGVPATVVLCSSPGAALAMPGMSHYGSGKLGMEYWVRAIAAEGGHAFAVVPYAVDTPMVRDVISQPVEQAPPVAAILREAAERGELATAESTAAEIWDLVLGGAEPGSAIAVGAVPPEVRVS